MKKNIKYIFVIGSTISGIGKGISTSSIAVLMENAGLKVNCMKIDPYLNIDAGMFNPSEHGETFVLADGLETDQDMGNYERFLNRDLYKIDYLTSGQVYKEVLEKERAFYYKGKTVEAVPHITDAIRERIINSAKSSKCDIQLIEIGGTLGDFQNTLFLETARLMSLKNKKDVLNILITYMPKPKILDEEKTRPTQHAIKLLNSFGINPDIVIVRSENVINEDKRLKIANGCGLDKSQIISAPDVNSIYTVPVNFYKQGLDKSLLKLLNIKSKSNNKLIKKWMDFNNRESKTKNGNSFIKIGIIGKYGFSENGVLKDAYLSINEALRFSAINNGLGLEIIHINSRDFEVKNNYPLIKKLKELNGVIIAGGFGGNGTEGKISALKYLRENNIPTLGICYGLQLMTIEIARNILGKKSANSTEINPNTNYPVVALQEDQVNKVKNNNYGGTMRLGNYKGKIAKNSQLYKIYKKDNIIERHRHRYEVNNKYINDLSSAGFVPVMYSESGLVEVCEYNKNRFYIGVQFHPELLARPLSPSLIFEAFIIASKKKR